ncbi:hypothetical protein ACHAW6_015938 [Cyclotella cf. meneghiniana]
MFASNSRTSPNEFVTEYNLAAIVYKGWVHFEIWRGIYGLPQSGILANNLLEKCFNHHGYYQTPTTPGLWQHKWHPILFCLIVDDFGIKYVETSHLQHLREALTEHYTISEDLTSRKFAGIDLKWNYPE